MRQLLAQLREPPLPGELAIPYLGDLPIFESVLRIVAKGKLAVNAGGRWYGREPDESYETADVRLRQRLGGFSGQAMLAVQLGDVSQVGGGGVAVPAGPTQPIPDPWPPVNPQPLAGRRNATERAATTTVNCCNANADYRSLAGAPGCSTLDGSQDRDQPAWRSRKMGAPGQPESDTSLAHIQWIDRQGTSRLVPQASTQAAGRASSDSAS